MKKVNTLFFTEWVSLKEIVNNKKGGHNYIFSHEERCKGQIVSILPFRRKLQVSGIITTQYLLKSEITPCWGNKHILSTITGGIEGYAKYDAVREIEEETGYRVPVEKLIDLGTSRGTKSSDSTYQLFSVDLTGYIKYKATGACGEKEEGKSKWVTKKGILDCVDPFASVIYLRLEKYLERG